VSGRPRLRSDLVLVEQTYRGEQSFIVKDPSTHKYFRFRPLEVSVMRTLDGERTVAEAARDLAERGIQVSAAAVGKFAEKLKAMGLCERTMMERSVLLMERLRAQRRQRLQTGPFRGELLRLRWSMADPDRFMDRTLPYLRFCFTRGFILASLALFAIYFVILAVRWPQFTLALSDLYHLRVSGGDLLVIWLTGLGIIAIHELGHGYTCKYFGGQVHEIGAMLFYFEPAFFCNVNDAWTFPELRARLWVTAAGSWIQMVVAGLGAIVWWAAVPDTLISLVALGAVLIGGFTTVLVNLNPLVPLDGYYALSDWLEIPNLRHRALAYLGWGIKTRVLGLDRPEPPADERERRIFLVYGALAAAYIGSIFLLIGGAVYGWLSRALGVIGFLLFAAVVWSMARGPIRDWARAGVEAWRQWRATAGPRRRLRPVLVFGVPAAVLAGILVPRPITVTGSYAVAAATRLVLVAPDTGVVFQVLVREGALVPGGEPLARIRNLDLEREAESAGRAVDSLAAREVQARASGREAESGRIAAARRAEAARLAGMHHRIEALTLRAPGRGIVVTARPEELAGLGVSPGDTLLELGQPDSVEVRVALDAAGAPYAREGQPVRLVSHADPAVRLVAVVAGISEAAEPAGAVESRIRLPAAAALRPGMTGEASVTIDRSNAWGALWWALRRRIRTDLLL